MATVETFRIKAEGYPHRCEICHQDDLFDPVSGHCSRCSSLLPVVPVLPPLPEGDFGGLWLLGDILLMVLSAGMGLIALAVFAAFGLWGIVQATLPEVLRMIGIMVFSMPGFALLYWYVRIYLERVDAFQARRTWFWTAVYNTLIVLILAGLGLGDESFGPTFLVFAVWPATVALYGVLSRRRYPLPETRPANDSE